MLGKNPKWLVFSGLIILITFLKTKIKANKIKKNLKNLSALFLIGLCKVHKYANPRPRNDTKYE